MVTANRLMIEDNRPGCQNFYFGRPSACEPRHFLLPRPAVGTPAAQPFSLEITRDFQQALDLMERGPGSCFVTGKAGTGKSTLLSYFRSHTKQKAAFLAPTGVAAVNIRGQTVHSFFGFRPDITADRARRLAARALKNDEAGLYRELDLLVIDEVSMVRADLLDCVDLFLKTVRQEKRLPFGGLRLAFIGDLYQLPPVVTAAEKTIFSEHYPSPYFFDAKVFSGTRMTMIELDKIYRQRDERFIEILNAVRNNTVTDNQVEELNRRCVETQENREEGDADEIRVCLTSTNEQAFLLNDRQLAALPGTPRTFRGVVDGDFDKKSMPTEEVLSLKKGAQVMLLNNDSPGRWVNGTMGVVLSLPKKDDDPIEVGLEDGAVVEVGPHSWEIFRYALNRDRNRVETETVGTFTQYPLKLAWAVTIHKAQGKTFDRVMIDTGRGIFATGQMYVALSRCRSLEGMTLRKPLRKNQVFVDWRVVKFLTAFQYGQSEAAVPLEDKKILVARAIRDGLSLELTYLKPSDEKSRRTIKPIQMGEMEYAGKTFLGIRGFCQKRQEERTFRLDRILEMRVVEGG